MAEPICCLASVFAADAVEVKEVAERIPGPSKANKTYYPKLKDTAKVDKNWYIIDADEQILGRMACLAVNHLR